MYSGKEQPVVINLGQGELRCHSLGVSEDRPEAAVNSPQHLSRKVSETFCIDRYITLLFVVEPSLENIFSATIPLANIKLIKREVVD